MKIAIGLTKEQWNVVFSALPLIPDDVNEENVITHGVSVDANVLAAELKAELYSELYEIATTCGALPKFLVTAHLQQAERIAAEIVNFGWVVGDNGICSKTNKGFLETTVDSNQQITHNLTPNTTTFGD